jgi:hypothetical protein
MLESQRRQYPLFLLAVRMVRKKDVIQGGYVEKVEEDD